MNIHRFFSFFCFLFSKALLIELDGRPGESLHQKVTGETHSSLGGWFQVPDLALRNHYFVVPLDYDSPDGTSISIFAREVVGTGKEEKQLPYLLYLQGGPGFECGRPTEAGGWVKKACEEYRVILLDQATCNLLCFDHQGFFCFGRLCN
jgi:hypothetical protein